MNRCRVCGKKLDSVIVVVTKMETDVRRERDGRIEEVLFHDKSEEKSFSCPHCLSPIGGDDDEPGGEEEVSREED